MIYVVKVTSCRKQINVDLVFYSERFNNFLGKVSDSLKMYPAMLNVLNIPNPIINKIFYFVKFSFRHWWLILANISFDYFSGAGVAGQERAMRMANGKSNQLALVDYIGTYFRENAFKIASL